MPQCLGHRYASPLRYPGGKARLAPSLLELLALNNLIGAEYVEPFAGGAGAALRLLLAGAVERIVLNDADRCVFAFWDSILNQTRRFLTRLKRSPLSLREWQRQRSIFRSRDEQTDFDLGFATFYLNRTNRSGILRNGSVIGGLAQGGEWGIGSRFNKDDLVSRIQTIAAQRARIEIHNMDALLFLRSYVRGNAGVKCLVYLDPPYFAKGSELYLNYYTKSDHERLARFLGRLQGVRWMMTYDNIDAVRQLYGGMTLVPFTLNYSLQHCRRGNELLIAPAQTLLSGRWTRHRHRATKTTPATARTQHGVLTEACR